LTIFELPKRCHHRRIQRSMSMSLLCRLSQCELLSMDVQLLMRKLPDCLFCAPSSYGPRSEVSGPCRSPFVRLIIVERDVYFALCFRSNLQVVGVAEMQFANLRGCFKPLKADPFACVLSIDRPPCPPSLACPDVNSQQKEYTTQHLYTMRAGPQISSLLYMSRESLLMYILW
jgi:hypothetical protein